MDHNNIPYGKILSTKELGEMVRYRRKELKATQTVVAGLSGVGLRFLSELERGKATVELGKALQVLRRLGLDIVVAPRNSTQNPG